MIIIFQKAYNQVGKNLGQYLNENHIILSINNYSKIIAILQLSLFSLLIFCSKKVFKSKNKIIIHRSNNRYTIFLTKYFNLFAINYYTYSDGIGDSVYLFHDENSKCYLGHFGVKVNFMGNKFFKEIDQDIYTEDWISFIKYSQKSTNALIQFKIPKHLSSDQNLEVYYKNTIEKFLLLGVDHFYVTGTDNFEFISDQNKSQFSFIGDLKSICNPITIKYFASTPTSSFISLRKILPKRNMTIIETPDNYFNALKHSINYFTSIK